MNQLPIRTVLNDHHGAALIPGQASENLRRAAVEMKAEELQKALGGLEGFSRRGV